MRTSFCISFCLLLICLSPLRAQLTQSHAEGAGQKEKDARNSSRAPLQGQGNSTIVHLDPGMQPTPFEQTILDKEREVLDLSIKRDFSGWEGLVSDDALAVYSDGYAKKADVLEAIKTGTDVHCAMDKLKFNVIGKGAGLITYRMTQAWKDAGKNQARQYYVSSLWVNRGGKWISSFWQETDTTPQPQLTKNADAKKDASTEFHPDSFFIAKEKEVWEALKHKDKTAATRLLADDFVGMYDSGFFNKTEWVKQIDDQYTVDDYTIVDPRVLHPSPTTALLLYTSTCKGTGAWADYCSHTSRISDMWVERNGHWQALFSQDVRAMAADQSDASVLKEILASEYRIVAALSRDDIEGFAKLLPEDVIDIDDDGIHTKAEWIPELQAQKDQGLLFRDFRFDDPKVIRLGPDQATFTAKEIIQGLDKGKPFELRYYTNATYVRRDGKWWPRVYQDTPMVK